MRIYWLMILGDHEFLIEHLCNRCTKQIEFSGQSGNNEVPDAILEFLLINDDVENRQIELVQTPYMLYNQRWITRDWSRTANNPRVTR